MSFTNSLLTSDSQLLCRQFYDVDELTQLLNTVRELKIEPLSLEPFKANFYQVDFNALTLIFAKAFSPVNMKGARRAGYTQFGVFLQLGANPAFVHQQSVNVHTLCGFDVTRGSDNIYPANTVIGEIQVRQWESVAALFSTALRVFLG